MRRRSANALHRREDKELLDGFRGPGYCGWCGRYCRNREAAHINTRGMGGWSRADVRLNIVALGSAYDCGCHYHSHNGERPIRADLIAIVAAREKMLQSDVEAALDELKWGRS